MADRGWIDDGSLSQGAPISKGVEKCKSSHPKVTQTNLPAGNGIQLQVTNFIKMLQPKKKAIVK